MQWALALTPTVTWALVIASQAETDGMRSVVPVMRVDVDVDVAGPGPCFEPRNDFLDLKTFI